VTFLFQNATLSQTYATVSANRSSTLTAHTETYVSPAKIQAGPYTLTGTFYSQANEAGIAVATVSVPLSVAADGSLQNPNGTALGQVAFAGVVKTVVVTPNQTVSQGSQLQLVATAYDASSNALALTPGSFTFQVTTGPQYLSVTSDGIATGVGPGQGSVEATVDGVSSAAASVNVLESFNHAFRFTQTTDTIQLTGGALSGACPLNSLFTVEVFLRPTSSNGYIWQQWTGGLMNELMQLNAGDLETIAVGSGQPQLFFQGTAVTLNQWNHLAWCYDGTNVRLYVNGQLALTQAAPNGFDPIVQAEACSIGRNEGLPGDGDLPFTGDLAGLRISSVARYTGSSFTPPTVPFAADSSTMLLVDPSSFSSAPTSFSAPGSQGITATLGAGSSAATSPTWVAYTP
jgi:hypothetical protein